MRISKSILRTKPGKHILRLYGFLGRYDLTAEYWRHGWMTENGPYAEKLLLSGGTKAAEGVLSVLKRNPPFQDILDYASLLVEIGHPKGVPFLEKNLRNRAFDAIKGSRKYDDMVRFVEQHSPAFRDYRAAADKVAILQHQELEKRVRTLDDKEMIDALLSLCVAYSENLSSRIRELEPECSLIGHELNRRGGVAKMREIFSAIPTDRGRRTLEMLWNNIGEWRG